MLSAGCRRVQSEPRGCEHGLLATWLLLRRPWSGPTCRAGMVLPITMCGSQHPVPCGGVGQPARLCGCHQGCSGRLWSPVAAYPLLRIRTGGQLHPHPGGPHSPDLELKTVRGIENVREIPHCIEKNISLLRWADPKHTFFNCLNDANLPTSNNLEIFVLESHSPSTFLQSLIISHFQPTFGNLSRGQIPF